MEGADAIILKLDEIKIDNEDNDRPFEGYSTPPHKNRWRESSDRLEMEQIIVKTDMVEISSKRKSKGDKVLQNDVFQNIGHGSRPNSRSEVPDNRISKPHAPKSRNEASHSDKVRPQRRHHVPSNKGNQASLNIENEVSQIKAAQLHSEYALDLSVIYQKSRVSHHKADSTTGYQATFTENLESSEFQTHKNKQQKAILSKKHNLLSENDPFLSENDPSLGKHEAFVRENRTFIRKYKATLREQTLLRKCKSFLYKHNAFLKEQEAIMKHPVIQNDSFQFDFNDDLLRVL